MRIPDPFLPVRVESKELCHTVHVVGRSYTFGPDGMLTSVIAQGHELLHAPMRIVMEEDGQPAEFNENYPDNESESFIQRRSDQEAVICGCKQSRRFILDFCNTVDYDGNIDIQMKLMTVGLTVAQVFGVGAIEPIRFQLDKLWLEVPLNKEICTLFHMYPNGEMILEDGSVRPQTNTSGSGQLPLPYAALPFKALLWLGDEERGLGWYAEREQYWQPEAPDKAFELIEKEDHLLLRIHLLDSHPSLWQGDPLKGSDLFQPIAYSFGFQATPLKPFPKNPYIHKALHIDCGIKVKGNYRDFFAANGRFDRLVEKGADTLILHEKWNKSQNWFELSEFTGNQLRFIVDECHKRGIKVMPYFGYELSAMSPMWQELNEKMLSRHENQLAQGGWWRVPYQRDYAVCYSAGYGDLLVDGITKLVDEYHLDGVYLDSTAIPRYCQSLSHGCGWYNEKGELKGTYPLKSIRKVFKNLFTSLKARGVQINVHTFGAANFVAMGFFDQNWYGENLQFDLMKGSDKDVDLDYFRAEYTGRNFGVPVEFLAYENRPLWTFEKALSCAILHGILPRPNDIEYPLELMSGVWKIMDAFPVDRARWMPYWSNRAQTNHDKVKVSYYQYTALDGEKQLLAFVVNISSQEIKGAEVVFEEKVEKARDMMSGKETPLSFDLGPFDYRILYVK